MQPTAETDSALARRLREFGDRFLPDLRDFRAMLAIFLTSLRVQSVLIILWFIDIMCIIAELAFASEYPSCERALQVCGLEQDHWCRAPPPRVMQIRRGLTQVSSLILLFFVLELLLEWFAVGFFVFLRDAWYVFDGIVIFGSAGLELASGGFSNNPHPDTGLLVFARAWRFIVLLQAFTELRSSGKSNRAIVHGDSAPSSTLGAALASQQQQQQNQQQAIASGGRDYHDDAGDTSYAPLLNDNA